MKKVALVTGCAKGIGREIALTLAQSGYDIIGTYNTSNICELKDKIDTIGVNCSFYKVDISKENDIDNLYNSVIKKYNHIDLIINNAALSLDSQIDDKTKEEFINVLEVNLIGPFLIIKKFKNIMKEGIVINICSTDGINTYSPLNIDYSASKAGLINLTKSLSLSLPDIKFYALCPNWVDTESIREMNPDYLASELKRIGQNSLIHPKIVAKKILFLIESNYKSGSVIVMEE